LIILILLDLDAMPSSLCTTYAVIAGNYFSLFIIYLVFNTFKMAMVRKDGSSLGVTSTKVEFQPRASKCEARGEVSYFRFPTFLISYFQKIFFGFFFLENIRSSLFCGQDSDYHLLNGCVGAMQREDKS